MGIRSEEYSGCSSILREQGNAEVKLSQCRKCLNGVDASLVGVLELRLPHLVDAPHQPSPTFTLAGDDDVALLRHWWRCTPNYGVQLGSIACRVPEGFLKADDEGQISRYSSVSGRMMGLAHRSHNFS